MTAFSEKYLTVNPNLKRDLVRRVNELEHTICMFDNISDEILNSHVVRSTQAKKLKTNVASVCITISLIALRSTSVVYY